LKVCGMKYPDNIREVARLKPDYMGFIFYSHSVRCVNEADVWTTIETLDENIIKVGVFVNHAFDEVIEICKKLKFRYAQLHGEETPAYAENIKLAGIQVIKVFHLRTDFNWNCIENFKDVADILLFDTPGPKYGGTGKKFEWKLLNKYRGDIPFFLSGGIDVDDIKKIYKLSFPRLYGIDVNSRMESSPALKDIKHLELLINELKNEK